MISAPHVSFATADEIGRARHAVHGDGALLIPGAATPEFCREVRQWMDADQASGKREKKYADTELRIWDAQQHHPLIDRFRQECDAFVSGLLHEPHRAYTILAIRNREIPPNDSRVELGRWHIDSFRRQLKVFLFLTPTSVDSGPFEYIPRTHASTFKAGMLLRGAYFKPQDLFARTRAYSKLPDALIDGLSHRGYRSQPVLVEAGTAMVVDTSAIHRARPCRSGHRYALTAYYR